MKRLVLFLACTLGAVAAAADRAAEIHARVFTIDTHLDTPTLSLVRPGWSMAERHEAIEDVSQCDFPRMREGGLKAGVFVVYEGQGPRTPEGFARARDSALQTFRRIHEMVARHPADCALALTADDGPRIAATGRRAIYVSIENGHVIGRDLTLLRTYHGLGARFFGLIHSGNNELGDSSGATQAEWGGLSPLGREVVAECNRLGLVVDASHASDAATREMIELSRTPVILTHSGCKAVYDHPRNVDDGLLRALAARGGVIQVNSVAHFLKAMPPDPAFEALRARRVQRSAAATSEAERVDLYREQERAARARPGRATFDDFMKHLLHAIAVAGVDHVGIGPDMDGGGGVVGMEDVADYPKITRALLEHGFSEADVAKVWGGNTLRVLRAAEAEARRAAAGRAPAPGA